MIGLSLSFCIRDIVSGLVNIDNVEKIITGTKCRTPEDWEYLISEYKNSYWYELNSKNEFKHVTVDILTILLRDGKIYQPKLKGEIPPNISKGIWVENEESLAKERQCSDCSIFEVHACPLELQVQRYPEEYRQPLVPTFRPETTPYQLGCYYFSKK